MKILHTADIHLDSAFCASSPSEAAARRERQRDVLRKIFSVAKSENCDIMLIAGDLFDTSFVTPETRELCISLFSDFGKPVVIAPGNHDPYVDGSFYKSSELPENVYVFTSRALQYFDFPDEGITVAGFAFTSAALPQDPLEGEVPLRQNEGKFVLCAHTELDALATRYAPISRADIERYGFDYAALGHVHNVPVISENIRYCGFPEGRSFDEHGDGGVLLVTLDGEGGLAVERRIISEQRYITESLSVSEFSTSADIELAVRNEIKRLSEGGGRTSLRLELVGFVHADGLPDLEALAREKYEGIGTLEITDGTLLLPDKNFLEKDTTLRGELYRCLKGSLTSDSDAERKLAVRALKIGLAAIDGRDFTEDRIK